MLWVSTEVVPMVQV